MPFWNRFRHAVHCSAGRSAASWGVGGGGSWVSAIRQPTVPPGTERLRVTLSAAHTDEEVDGLVTALATVLAPVAPR